MPTIFPKKNEMNNYNPESLKTELVTEHRIDRLEDEVTRISNKLDLLINQLKIEFYKPTIPNINEQT